jgi:peptide/nickel transport system substrate-binding protein
MKYQKVILPILILMVSFGYAQTSQDSTISIGIQNQPEVLNPVLPIELNGLIVTGTLYAPLTAVNPETLTTEPYLAESWEVSDDLMTWTFFLRPEAVWHDGEAITAEDVQFTIERIQDPEENTDTHTASLQIDRVEVVDDHTVTFHLNAPNALFPDVLSSGGWEPLPKHVYENFERLTDAVEFNTRTPVGSGAFRIGRIESGSQVEVLAFDDFFFGRPNVDRIVFRIVADQNAAVAQMRAGDLDWTNIEPVHLRAIEGDSQLEAFPTSGSRYVLALINLGETWEQTLGDFLVRQAMFHAVDREAIAERIGLGLTPVMDRVVPSTLGWVPTPDVDPYRYDLERAQALLEEAGWIDTDGDGIREKDGETLSFYVLVDRGNVIREQIGLVLQQSWQEVGMDVDYIVSERTGRWIEETRAGTFPVRMTSFPIPNGDWVYRIFHSNGLNNSASYVNPEVDSLLDGMLAAGEQDEQGRLVSQADALIYQDAFTMPFFLLPNLHAINSRLNNVPRGELKLATPYAWQISVEE